MLELSVGAPQRRLAVNLFAELNVGVELATRGEWLGDVPHTYFYGNCRANVPKILMKWSNLTAVRPGKLGNSQWEGQKKRAVPKFHESALADEEREPYTVRYDAVNADLNFE